MDRAIDPVFASSQKRRRLFMVAAAAGLLALAFGFGPSLLKPSVLRSRVRIEKVDRGPVEASIAANGTVTPELEQGTRAPRDSVVTWTVTEAGALVRRGEPLARLSDLKSFRIEATVSAVHGRSLRPGLEALVRIGTVDLRGTVSTVEPTVRDGVMRLWVRLEDATNVVLRPSLKADVQIVTDTAPTRFGWRAGRSSAGTRARTFLWFATAGLSGRGWTSASSATTWWRSRAASNRKTK